MLVRLENATNPVGMVGGIAMSVGAIMTQKRRLGVASVVAVMAVVLAACFPYEPDDTFGTDGKIELASTTNDVYRPWPTADGGFIQQEFTGNQIIRSYAEDGSVVNSWVMGPIALSEMKFGGHKPNGDMVLFGTRKGFINYAVTLVVNPVTGAFTELGAPWGQFARPNAADVAPNGRHVSVISQDYLIRVQTFTAASVVLSAFQAEMTDELGEDCSSSSEPMQVTMFDDGSLVAAAARCDGTTSNANYIGFESVRFLPTGELDTSYGGGDGHAVLMSTDDGSTMAPLRSIVGSDDGSMAVLTQAGTMQRLGPDGSVDSTFGLVSVSSAMGGVPTSVIADGTGYAVSLAPFTGFCTTGPAEIRQIIANGNHTGKTTLPWSLDGADLSRYPDGRLLVSGVSSTLTFVGGNPTCAAPHIPKLARLDLTD